MSENALFMITVGAILLAGLAADYLGRRTFLPRVTILLMMGVLIGDQSLGLIPASVSAQFESITVMTLAMVGFLLGGKLTRSMFQNSGWQLISISLLAALGTTVVVGSVLAILGWPFEVAVILGCIAAATAPAATMDTVDESNQRSRFSQLLLGIVAIDDAWALILLSLGLSVLAIAHGANDITLSLAHAIGDIGGAVALGLAIGFPAALLTGRIRPGRPMLLEALGLVFFCGGLALWLDVSFIIASMVMGAVIANTATHHGYPFHAIENIEWPFLIVFFVLAGASLDLVLVSQLGLLGFVYVLTRIVGKFSGAWLGATVSRAPTAVRNWMGLALLPQAGVAIGMALLAASRFPEHGQLVLTVVTGTTVMFELFGPIGTRIALRRAGQAEAAATSDQTTKPQVNTPSRAGRYR